MCIFQLIHSKRLLHSCSACEKRYKIGTHGSVSSKSMEEVWRIGSTSMVVKKGRHFCAKKMSMAWSNAVRRSQAISFRLFRDAYNIIVDYT